MTFEKLIDMLADHPLYEAVMERSHDFLQLRGLYDVAVKHRGADAVEIGTFGGVSTAVIAIAVAPGRVHTADISSAMAESASKLWHDLGIENVVPYTVDSLEFLETSPRDGVGLALIDGLHSYTRARQEFMKLKGMLPSGATIVIDDYHYVHKDSNGDGGIPKLLEEIDHEIINGVYAIHTVAGDNDAQS
jgi:predicted O-methyltransferase YrrM